jgi:alpha-ketoglutarate-dependent 2,4-dichlorophenoxyacetate dioxygenase
MLGNRLWHTDASYMPVPVVLGMLFAVAVPPASALGAGETEFADMRAAYDALDDEMKAAIDGLVVEHDIFWSRGQIGFTEFPPGEREKYPPSPQKLMRRHPGSGRKTLYLSAHASHIVGWPVADGRLLLSDLNAHATQRQFVYSHKWATGDLVIWDNRCTMHRGRPQRERAARPAARDDARCRLDFGRSGLVSRVAGRQEGADLLDISAGGNERRVFAPPCVGDRRLIFEPQYAQNMVHLGIVVGERHVNPL